MNVNQVKAPVATITMGGKDYSLQYDLNAFAALEDKYGSIDAAMAKMEKGTISSVRAFIWAGLQNSENPPTEKEVGSLLQLGDLEAVTKALATALEGSLPEASSDPNEQGQ